MRMKKLNFHDRKLHTKHELLLSFIKNKNVVHYGCIDDSTDIIDWKIKKNIYLHKLISEASKNCIGIDINRKNMTYLRETHQISNIYYGNAENPETFETDKETLLNTEVILIPDLIEHLNNPGLMLEGLRKFFPKTATILILTPNPFSYLNFIFTLFNREFYNAYHTCYFSTNNMKVLLENHGFKINKVYPCFLPKNRGWFVRCFDKAMNHFLTLFTYGFCDNYLYACEFQKE